jgi:DNA-binding response OmpR family regulator
MSDKSPPNSISSVDENSKPIWIRRILVVDDDDAYLDLVRAVLTHAGFRVNTALDGEEGWTALCAAPYDLLITDNDMPRLTGVELVMRLRQAGMTLPVIMASGSLVLGPFTDSAFLGLTGFLRKPFSIQELVDFVSVRCRSSTMRPECEGSRSNEFTRSSP